MPVVLVVDDAPIDRRLAGGLIEHDPNLSVAFANDGSEALDAIQSNRPDIVLTDLQMPGMDGLELTSTIKARYPGLPVVLMTGRGSEDTAVKALRAGAANYVPKSVLADELLDTLRTVLDAKDEERNLAQLVKFLHQCRDVFSLPNDSPMITAMVSYFQLRIVRMGICDEADRVRIGVALEEALVNAVFHGNLEIDSTVRERDRNEYRGLVEERRNMPPYRDRLVHVTAEISRRAAVFTIRDEGPGFDPNTVADPLQTDLDKLTGRGLLLMRTFMDEVNFSDQGNEVTLVKRSA